MTSVSLLLDAGAHNFCKGGLVPSVDTSLFYAYSNPFHSKFFIFKILGDPNSFQLILERLFLGSVFWRIHNAMNNWKR